MAENSEKTGERQILSNVGQIRLEEMLVQAEEIRTRIDDGMWGGHYNADLYPFLDPNKDLVLIDRNPEYLKEISDRMFGVLMPDRKPMMMIKAMFPHHMVDDSFLEGFYNQGGGDPLIAYRRVKGSDSIAEKLTRVLAKEGSLVHPLRTGLVIEDINGETFVSKTEEECYALREKIQSLPFLELVEEEDFMAQPTHSGYRAIHDTYFWQNGNPRLSGITIDVHHETMDDFRANREGVPNCPERSHICYGFRKLEDPHEQGNYQIVIFESEKVRIPRLIKNVFSEYYLV